MTNPAQRPQGHRNARGNPRGFSLIELMIAVAIVGTLATVASVGLTMYARKSRSSEGINGLSHMHKLAAAYFYFDRSERGRHSDPKTRCIVKRLVSAGNNVGVWNTGGKKQLAVNTAPALLDLGFDMSGYRFYGFSINTNFGPVDGICNVEGPLNNVYTYVANADFDGDGKPHGLTLWSTVNADHDLVLQYGIRQVPHGKVVLGVTFEHEF